MRGSVKKGLKIILFFLKVFSSFSMSWTFLVEIGILHYIFMTFLLDIGMYSIYLYSFPILSRRVYEILAFFYQLSYV